MAWLACATWRAADVAMTHNSDVLAAQGRHHEELVSSIESLAEKTGILTSADLCPVRFRLRRADGYTVPLASPIATLEIESDGEYRFRGSSAATPAGTIDFGLIAPGRYRVTFRTADGMHLRHDFDVLPGVPIDRLVTCPGQSAPSYSVQLHVDWPDGIDAERLLAVYCIEPAPVTSGEWRWQPSNESRPIHVLAASPGVEIPDSETARLGQSIALLDDSIGELQSAAQFHTTFRYCRISRIMFLKLTGDGPDAESMGTVVFGNDQTITETSGVSGATIHSSSPPPELELDFVKHQWLIGMPDDIIRWLSREIERMDGRGEEPPGDRGIVGVP